MRSESEMEGKGKQATTKLVSEKTSYEVCAFFGGWREVVGSDVCERCGVQGEALPGYDVLTPFGHP